MNSEIKEKKRKATYKFEHYFKSKSIMNEEDKTENPKIKLKSKLQTFAANSSE